jgi:hypothetical protein
MKFSQKPPDMIDHMIFKMLGEGRTLAKIAAELGMKEASAEGRVYRLKAKRWVTYDGKFLTPAQREHLLWIERDAFHKSGKVAV